jgi:hypothetical protein
MLWRVSAGVAPFVFTGVSFPLAVQLTLADLAFAGQASREACWRRPHTANDCLFRCATLNRDIAASPKIKAVRGLGRRAKIFGIGLCGHSRRCLPPPQGKRTEGPMTVSSPNVIEIKLDRLIDDMRILRSQMIAFDRHLKGIEAYLKTTELNEQQFQSKSRPWFAAAATATARTVLFAVGAATGAVLLYLGTWPDNGIAISALMSTPP